MLTVCLFVCSHLFNSDQTTLVQFWSDNSCTILIKQLVQFWSKRSSTLFKLTIQFWSKRSSILIEKKFNSVQTDNTILIKKKFNSVQTENTILIEKKFNSVRLSKYPIFTEISYAILYPLIPIIKKNKISRKSHIMSGIISTSFTCIGL